MVRIFQFRHKPAWLVLILSSLICICGLSQEMHDNPGSGKVDSLNSVHLNKMEFRRFDKNRDGLVSRTEYDNLTRAAARVHSRTPQQQHRDGFAIMDLDGDNSVNFQEFKFNLVRDTIAWPGSSYPNVVYKRIGETWLLMDILMPTNDIFDKAPVLYFVHGGGFRSGAKEYLRLNDQRAETALLFAAEGFCCVSVRYRLVNHDPDEGVVLIPDCVTDAWDGLRFLKKNAEKYQIDPHNIIIWGESAGGHIAQMLTFSDPGDFTGDPELAAEDVSPVAGISWYGPTDFTGSLKQEAGNAQQNRHLMNVTGKSNYSEDDLETLRKVSPYFQVDHSDPPLLLMQGDSDHAVHISHATRLNERAREVGAKVELVLVKNAGHNWRQVGDPIQPGKSELRKIMLDFARSQITKEPQEKRTLRQKTIEQ